MPPCQPVDPFPDFRPQRLRARAIRAPSNSSVCVTGVPAKRGHRFSPPGKTRCPPDHAGWLTAKRRPSLTRGPVTEGVHIPGTLVPTGAVDLRSPIRRLSHLHGWRRSSPPTPQQPSRKLCIPTARNTPRAPVRRAEGDGRPGRPPPRRGVVLQRPPTPRPCDRHRLRRRTATLRRLLPDVWGPKDRISLGRNPPWDTRVVALVVPEHATTEPPSRCASNADDSPARRPGGCGRGSSRTAQRSGSTTRRGPIPPRGSHHGRRVRR